MSGGHAFPNAFVNLKRRPLGHTALYFSHVGQNMLLLLLALLFLALPSLSNDVLMFAPVLVCGL